MAAAPAAHQNYLQRLYALARRDAFHGVVDQTQKVRLRYWAHWSHFCRTLNANVDPFLTGVETSTTIDLLEGFARYIREGNAGRGHQVRSGSVSDALCAVGKTFEMARMPNPTYQPTAYGTYWYPLQQILKAYSREDPKSQPQLAVPLAVPEHLVSAAMTSHSHDPAYTAIADLTNIAFYYLLRVGEYTRPRSNKILTVPFRVMDVTFRTPGGTLIPNTAPLADLLQAAEATIRIPDQKNGDKGQCVHQTCTHTALSPIKSLARRINHIMTNNGTPSTPIYYYKHPLYTTWRQVKADQITQAVKAASHAVGLYKLGYSKDDVSSHSLRAGGAMAMHLNGVDTITIRKMGRWKSDTFLMYIHEQISAFATGVSIKMSNHIPFRHIAGPTTT